MDMQQLDPALIQQILAMEEMDQDPQAIQLARQQKMAEGLRQQSMQPGQGQMVGRRYVGPGIADNIRQVAQGYQAGQQQRGVDAGMMDMQKSRTSGKSAYMNALMNAMRRAPAPGGVQGVVPAAPSDDLGNDPALGY